VAVADNGVQALERLERHGRFDVVLMDMQMPDMDGLTATRHIRTNPAYEGMAVVALTANAGAEYRAECLEAGMDDFALKPIDPDELYGTVARWVAASRSAGAPAEVLPQR
jgi:two-component system sensor histidine kinase/response regulator